MTSFDYDARLRLWRTTDPDGAVVETHFDAADQPIVAVDGAGRKTRTVYDVMGRPETVIRAWRGANDGTGSTLDCAQMLASYDPATGYLQTCYSVATYTASGEVATLADAGGFLTGHEYDKLDRLTRTRFPSKTTPGEVSSTDDELLAHDALGHQASKRTRRGETIWPIRYLKQLAKMSSL